jgi:hypothetical protein
MAEVIYLRCRHCGELMKNNPWPYCAPCNLELCYRAMPLLLGMLMTGHMAPNVPAVNQPQKGQFSRKPYEHYRDIMD